MKNAILLIALFITGISFGQVKEKVGNFKTVKVSDQIPLELIPSSENSIEINGEEADEVVYKNKNGDLKIRMKLLKKLQGDDLTVKLYYTGELKEIYTTEGATVNSSSSVKTPQLKLRANKGSSIKLNIQTKKLEVKTNSGGRITTSGQAVSQDVVSNSGGKYYGKDLKNSTTTVTVNAGGSAVINASDSVVAKTRAGGNIDIYGGADVDKTRVAGGTVNVH